MCLDKIFADHRSRSLCSASLQSCGVFLRFLLNAFLFLLQFLISITPFRLRQKLGLLFLLSEQ